MSEVLALLDAPLQCQKTWHVLGKTCFLMSASHEALGKAPALLRLQDVTTVCEVGLSQQLWGDPNRSWESLVSHSPSQMIDLCDLVCVTSHEEERDTEQRGGGQHHYRETWDGLQGQTHPLHDDATQQHPYGNRWQVQSPWKQRELSLTLIAFTQGLWGLHTPTKRLL